MQITNLLTTIHNNKIAIYNIYNERERERERESCIFSAMRADLFINKYNNSAYFFLLLIHFSVSSKHQISDY
jgi:hypothetical protein